MAHIHMKDTTVMRATAHPITVSSRAKRQLQLSIADANWLFLRHLAEQHDTATGE